MSYIIIGWEGLPYYYVLLVLDTLIHYLNYGLLVLAMSAQIESFNPLIYKVSVCSLYIYICMQQLATIPEWYIYKKSLT